MVTLYFVHYRDMNNKILLTFLYTIRLSWFVLWKKKSLSSWRHNTSRNGKSSSILSLRNFKIFRYKWQPSPWSACRANSPISSTIRMDTGPNAALTSANPPVTSSSSQICGGGIQMRGLTCLRLSDSRPVNSRLCRALTLLPTVQQWVSIYRIVLPVYEAC